MSSDCPLCGAAAGFFAYSQKRPFFRCPECGLIHLGAEHRLSAQEEKKRYSLHRNSPDDSDYRAFLNKLVQPLCGVLRKDALGLDYGCGPGPALSVIMKEMGFFVDNYDPYFAADETLLEKKYDFIACTETAEHFYYPRQEFNRLQNLILPGGWLAVMTHVYDDACPFDEWYYAKDPTHVSIYTPRSWAWLARNYRWKAVFPERNVVFFQRQF